jgi:hypothetical protein
VNTSDSPEDAAVEDAALEDAARYSEIAAALFSTVDRALDAWVEHTLRSRGITDPPILAATVASVRSRALPDLDELLAADIDQHRSTPLEILRRATAPMTEALRAQGMRPDPRAMDERDPFQIGPMTWSDLNAEVAEAGMTWGAAKAHIHISRRRRVPPGS